MREAVSNQGAQSRAQHATTAEMIKQLEDRMHMHSQDMMHQLQASMGGFGGVDLDAKEQKYLDQIMAVLAQSEADAPSASRSSAPGERLGCSATCGLCIC